MTQRKTPLDFNFLESYLCDPAFEAQTLALLFAMKKALAKRKLTKFNNEDIFNFVLMVLCELEKQPDSQIEMNIKHKPEIVLQ